MTFQLIYHLIIVFSVTNFKASITNNQQITSNTKQTLTFNQTRYLTHGQLLLLVYEPPLLHIIVTKTFLPFPPLSGFLMTVKNPSFISSQSHSNKSFRVGNFLFVVNCFRWLIEITTGAIIERASVRGTTIGGASHHKYIQVNYFLKQINQFPADFCSLNCFCRK